MSKDKTGDEIKTKTTKAKSKAKEKDVTTGSKSKPVEKAIPKKNEIAKELPKNKAITKQKAKAAPEKNLKDKKPAVKKASTAKAVTKKVQVQEVQQDFLFDEKPVIIEEKPTKTAVKKPIEKAEKKEEKPKKETAKPEKAEEKATAPKNNKTTEVTLESLKVAGKSPVILQVLPELKSGGVERGTIEIAKAGVQLGYKMIVTSNGGNLVGQLENAGVKHIFLPLATKNPFTIIGNIKRIRNIIKEYNVNIVHARSRAPAWSAYFAAKKAKCRFITTFHGSYSYNNPLKKLYNSVMTKGEVVIAISNFIKEHVIKDYHVDAKKVKLIPRGVDLDQFTRDKVHKIRIINMAAHFSIELDVPVILLPGRFARWKGQSYLIDALSLIKDEKFVCILAGYDKKHQKYYKELEKQVKEKGLFHKVRMIGEIKDMPALYSLSDIVISSSVKPEAFGRVAIEGQAMEKMVVATNLGGSCETVIDGETGWLVKPNDVEGFAKTLKEVLNVGVNKRKEIITKARKNIEDNFSMESMVKRTFAVYKEVLGKK